MAQEQLKSRGGAEQPKRNPQPNVISVQLGPRAGRASISNRMRLADTQTVIDIAELSDGTTRTFVGKTHRTIQYDRGGRFGSTQQDLTGGQYEFRITSTGWDLVRKPDIHSSRTAVRANTLPDGAVR